MILFAVERAVLFIVLNKNECSVIRAPVQQVTYPWVIVDLQYTLSKNQFLIRSN